MYRTQEKTKRKNVTQSDEVPQKLLEWINDIYTIDKHTN